MRKENLIKMLVLNLAIVLVNIFLFSNAFLHLDMSGSNALTMALGITVIVMSVVVFIAGNYRLLSYKEPAIHHYEIKSLDDCTAAVRQNTDKKTFAANLETVQNQIRRFKKKKETIQEILLQKFSESEMSYQSFQNALTAMEQVAYFNIKSLLNRISAFDENEYEQIKKSDTIGKFTRSRLDIYNEYIKFAEDALEDNEQILLKLDHLLLEISKFNSLEDGEIEEMSAMKEIDDLIHNAKWYR